MKRILIFFASLLALAGVAALISGYPNTTSVQSGDLFIIERPGIGNFNISANQMPGELGVQPTNSNLTDWGQWGTNAYANALLATSQTAINTSSNAVLANAQTAINTTSNSLQGQITSGGVTLTQLNATSNSVYGNAQTAINTTSNILAGVDATKANAATTLTVAGTANQITSSAGAQDFSANHTVTLSLPNPITTPGAMNVAGGFSNQTLTASTLLEADANKKLVSIPNSTGALTNDGNGNVGYAPLLDASSLNQNEIPYIGSATNLLGSTNNTEFEIVLAPSSNATNYPLDLNNARKVEIFTANTNCNLTFLNANTNHSVDVYVNALTSTVPCTITWPAHIRLNHFASLSVSNTTATYYHIDFFNGTDPTNAIVTGGDYYQIQ